MLTPKNWDSFQHYKDRSPAWIKLHRSLLDDFAFSRLPVASRALAPLLWLLASEYEGGKIMATTEELAFRLRMSHDDLLSSLSPLVESGFFDASTPIAECKREAIPEKEEEKQEKKEEEKRENYAREFDELWFRYPNKVGKKDALRAYVKARKSGHDIETISDGLDRYIRAKPFDRSWLNLATFFNGQRWNDQIALPSTGPPAVRPTTVHQQKHAEGRAILNELHEFNTSAGGREDTRILRHDPGFEPEGVRGGFGGNLVELSPSRDRARG